MRSACAFCWLGAASFAVMLAQRAQGGGAEDIRGGLWKLGMACDRSPLSQLTGETAVNTRVHSSITVYRFRFRLGYTLRPHVWTTTNAIKYGTLCLDHVLSPRVTTQH